MKKLFLLLGLFGGFAHAESNGSAYSCTIQYADNDGIHTEQCESFTTYTIGGHRNIVVSATKHGVIFQSDDLSVGKTDKGFDVYPATSEKTVDMQTDRVIHEEYDSGQCIVNDNQAFSCKAGKYMANGVFN